MSRSRPRVEVEDDLNLSPIMNLVMILIPLLLLSVEFSKASVIELESPRRESPGDDNRDTEVLVPSVVVGVSFDGFRISTLGASVEGFSELVPPDPNCGGDGSGPTICLRQDADPAASLVQRLDYGELYNRLVEIRLNPRWYEQFGVEGGQIHIVADEEVPFEALVRTMDTSRNLLSDACGSAGPSQQCASGMAEGPTTGGEHSRYQLGGQDLSPSEAIERATIVRGGRFVTASGAAALFQSPSLLLPQSTGSARDGE